MTNVVVTQETIDRLADDLAARQLNAEVEIFTEMFEEATRKGFIQQQANQKPTSLEFAADALRQYVWEVNR